MPDTTNIRETLHASYKLNAWQALLGDLFPEGSLALLRQPEELKVNHEKVTATRQLGTLTLPGDD